MSMSINVLPSEILHTVLTIYAKDVKDILNFSSVCKEWKEMADNSQLWLTLELSFYCPARYFKLCSEPNFRTLGPDLELEKMRIADASPVLIDISSSVVPLLARRYKVIADRSNLLDKLQLVPSSVAANKQTETCKLIRDRFSHLKRAYYHQWEWYSQWMGSINTITKISQVITTKEFLLTFLVGSFICKLIAFVCFTIIPNHDTSLNLMNHLGFGALYFNEFCHILTGLAGISCTIGCAFHSNQFLDYVPINLTSVLPYLVLMTAAMGISLSLLSFQLCLSENVSNDYYPLATIPLWIFTLLIVSFWTAHYFRDEQQQQREELRSIAYFVFSMSSILLIPIGFTLFSFAYFDSNQVNVILSTIPFLLAEIVFLHRVGSSVCEVFNEVKVIASLESLTSLHFFRLYLLVIKSFLMISCVVVVILFHILICMSDYSLSKGLGLGVLWYLFFESAILVRFFLQFHLT